MQSPGWLTPDNPRYLLELARGLVPFSSLDPLPPEVEYAPIWHPIAVSRAYVQNGHFVMWIDGWIEGQIETPGLDHGTWLRGAMWCRDIDGKLLCSTYSPQYRTPLALKTQPRGPLQPWDKFPWESVHRFDISPSGEFILQ